MKTIDQLFKEHGETFPFKVRHADGAPGVFFHCVARTPKGSWIGWNEYGRTDTWLGLKAEYELYKEPKVEEKKYEWLVFTTSGSVYTGGYIFTEKEAKENWPNAIKLVPQRELDPVTCKLVEVKL